MPDSSVPFRRVAVAALMLLLLLPAVAAQDSEETAALVTWNVPDLHVLPQLTHDESEAVVFSQVRDHNNEPVIGDRCDRINVLYDYAGDTDIRMTNMSLPESWYYDEFEVVEPYDNITLKTEGSCDDVPASDWQTDWEEFQADGDLEMELLTNLSGENREFWEEESFTARWNVTRFIPGVDEPGTIVFFPHGNVSYELLSPDMQVHDEGRIAADEINKWYETEVELPEGPGMYILNTVGHNESLEEDYSDTDNPYDNPYGGVATPIWVEPTYPEGHSMLYAEEERCRDDQYPPTCEKEGDIEVGWWEDHVELDLVNATIRGQATGAEYDEITLDRWNDTYWNTSFTIPADFDTRTYGHSLEIDYRAYHWFERDGVRDQSVEDDRQFVDIERFDLVESSPPFIQLGETIDIGVTPISPITEDPLDPEHFTDINLSVYHDVNGTVIHRDRVTDPDSIYDEGQNMFRYPFDVPVNVSTGVYNAHMTVGDNFSATNSIESDFRVISANDTTEPIVLMGASGEQGNENISVSYEEPGAYTERAILHNVGPDLERVQVFFDGDLEEFSTFEDDQPVRLAPGQTQVLEFVFAPTDSGDYSGNVLFDVEGSYIEPYNITVSTDISVDCMDTFGDSFCVTRTDLSEEVLDVGGYSLEIDVENTENQSETFDVRVEGGLTAITTGENEWTETVGPLNETTVEIPYTAGQHDSGLYEGDIILAAHERSAGFNASVDIEITDDEIEAYTNEPELGDFVEGEDVTFSIVMNNTGTIPIDSVDISSTALDFTDQDEVSLEPMESVERNYTVQAPADVRDTAEVTVESGNAEASVTFEIDTFQDFSDDISELQNWIGQRQDELERLDGQDNIDAALWEDVRSDLTRMESDINDADRAWSGGNYMQAEQKYQDADALQGTVESNMANLEVEEPVNGDGNGDDEGGIGLDTFLLPMLIILILFVISGIILYFSIVPEKDQY